MTLMMKVLRLTLTVSEATPTVRQEIAAGEFASLLLDEGHFICTWKL